MYSYQQKVFITLIIVLIVSFHFTGCGSSPESPNHVNSPLSTTILGDELRPTIAATDELIPEQFNYVDGESGSNLNPGSKDQPWQTIQHATDALQDGGTVFVLEGYYPERVKITRPNLTFRASGEVLMAGFSIEADYTTIAGFTIMSLVDDVPEGIGIDVPNAGHCRIEDNRFLYNTWGGLRLFGSAKNPSASHDCIVRNNLFFRNALYAAEVMGKNHWIENNDISQTIQHHPCSASTASWLDADAFRFHGSGHVFRNNSIHNMPFGGAGYDQTDCSLDNLSNLSLDFVSDAHMDCFQTYDGDQIAGHDILFEGNSCELPTADKWPGGDAGAKVFQATGNAYNLTIRNNLVEADLLSFFADGCHDIRIVHNTFIGSGETNSQGLKFVDCSGNIQIMNNIFYNQRNGVGHIWQENTPVHAGYNCVYVEGRSPSRPADPEDVWNVDPLLAVGFRLTADSPCIDTGADLGVSADFDGRSRPQGNGVDIGAFEFIIP